MSGCLVEETRLDGDLAQRDLDAAQVGLHDSQQVGQGTGPVRAVRWTPETGQVAKRESPLGTADWPEVRHDQYSEAAWG